MSAPPFPPPGSSPAGWYPDHGDPARVRYFDGRGWTTHTGPRGAGGRALGDGRLDPHPVLPLVAAFGALAVLAVALVAFQLALDPLVDTGWPAAVLLVVVSVIVYAPSCVWMWYASRRWGSGRPLRDLGMVPRLGDIGWGVVVLLGALAFGGLAIAVVRALDVPFRSILDLSVVADTRRTVLWSYGLSLVLVAPIVEEAMFRGLVLRGFLSRLGPPAAVVAQGVLFGVAHFDPDFGREAIGLLIVLAVIGMCFGAAAYQFRRVGPAVLAHALFNGISFVVAVNSD